MKKRLLKIKWENLLLILLIPLATIQFIQANMDLKLLSVCMSLILYGGFYITLKTIRKEALLSVKNEIEKPIFKTIINYVYLYGNTKKEITKQAIYTNDQVYILRASFK